MAMVKNISLPSAFCPIEGEEGSPMELRLLATEAERETFEQGMRRARALNGRGFCETSRSCVGRIHIAFSDLFGVFDEAEPDRILAGFAMHSLDLFGQSYPKPDLTHLPPSRVYEVGELWAASLGAGAAARRGCTLLAGMRRAAAFLIYPIVQPWNLTTAYPDFEAVGDPIEWPFAQTLDGQKVYVQAMVIMGEAMRRTVARAEAAGFEALDDGRVLRFENPLEAVLTQRRLARQEGRFVGSDAPRIPLGRVAAKLPAANAGGSSEIGAAMGG